VIQEPWRRTAPVSATREVGRNAGTSEKPHTTCSILAPLVLSINPCCLEAAARHTWPWLSAGATAARGKDEQVTVLEEETENTVQSSSQAA